MTSGVPDATEIVPGTEASYPFDTVKLHPELFKTVVGGLALEHFGGLQFVENGNDYDQVVSALKTMEDWDGKDRRPIVVVGCRAGLGGVLMGHRSLGVVN